ncbi:hypothetical protein INT46_010326 [Mucor plumbeus]|uniref:Integrase zinc-binding domain-containing protein n=1 Tax=Mucor plumbeus TaxID=97098 RepID=A0A8H7RI72_9FUNG|nr:hypothetical protein INT46_010326 [Mucor plumbeus]
MVLKSNMSPVDEEAGEEILEQLFSAMVILETCKTLDYESEMKEIYACLTRVGPLEMTPKNFRRLESTAKKYMVGIPFISERHGILIEFHDGHDHFGFHSTWSILYRNYWWPSIFDEMKDFLHYSCHVCQLFSPAPHIRPLPESKLGSKYVLVCTEMFTCWPMAVATKKSDAITAATFLHKFGTPYHPENQGIIEKLNYTLITAIKKSSISCPSDWDTHLNTILYAYRVRAHEALEISPFELLYGVVPVDAQRDPLLSFGKALGFDRLLWLPDMHNEIITKDSHVRSLDPPIHQQDKLDVHWVVDKMYTVVSAFKNNTYLIVDIKTGKMLNRRTNGTHFRRHFNRPDD